MTDPIPLWPALREPNDSLYLPNSMSDSSWTTAISFGLRPNFFVAAFTAVPEPFIKTSDLQINGFAWALKQLNSFRLFHSASPPTFSAEAEWKKIGRAHV